MRFDHMAFEVSDLEHSIAFYGNALGFTESWRHRNEEENEECVFLALGNVRLELLVRLDGTFKGLPAPQTPYCPHLAIGVDDLDIAINQLKENKQNDSNLVRVKGNKCPDSIIRDRLGRLNQAHFLFV